MKSLIDRQTLAFSRKIKNTSGYFSANNLIAMHCVHVPEDNSYIHRVRKLGTTFSKGVQPECGIRQKGHTVALAMEVRCRDVLLDTVVPEASSVLASPTFCRSDPKQNFRTSWIC
jgi:hypothetical protein